MDTDAPDRHTASSSSDTGSATDAVAGQLSEPAKDLASQAPADVQWPEGTDQYYGACILPVNLSEVTDKEGNSAIVPFALLARDAKTQKFTVLGGRPDAQDKWDPLRTAVREAYEESIACFCDTIEKGYTDISALGDNILHVEYRKTKYPYHIYVVPSQLSNAMLGLFQDRATELAKKGTIDAKKIEDAQKAVFQEKDLLVWVPIDAAVEDTKHISWFTRQILTQVKDDAKAINETLDEDEARKDMEKMNE